MEKVVSTYFCQSSPSAHRLAYTDQQLSVAWGTIPRLNPSSPEVSFAPMRILLDERDQRVLVGFDGNIIPSATSSNTKMLARWKWPEFALCVNHNHPYVHVPPPLPAWKADSGHVIVPIERYLMLMRAGNFAFFRWDEKTLRRMVTFCNVEMQNAGRARVSWHNTSP